MRNIIRKNLISLVPGAAAILALPGCGDLVRSNLVTGARDGAVTATTGIVEGFFARQFGVASSDEEADAATQQTESGHDLFVHL